jgi:phage head maturation protease
MKVSYHGKGASISEAPVVDSDSGGFTAIASTGSVDRDGEIIRPGALTLPDSIPVHADHSFSVDRVIGRGQPYYRGAELWLDVTLGSGQAAQEVRQKISERLLDSVSIVFSGQKWETINGVRTCTKGELLACDVVTVPSNRDARILSVRGIGQQRPTSTNEARWQAQLALMEAELADAKAVLAEAQRLTPSQPTTADVRRFLRSL